jgi:hypothetical protein
MSRKELGKRVADAGVIIDNKDAVCSDGVELRASSLYQLRVASVYLRPLPAGHQRTTAICFNPASLPKRWKNGGSC